MGSSKVLARVLGAGTIIVVAAAAVVADVSASTSARACRPTASDPIGPFQASGAAPPRRARIGTGHILVGRVLRAPDCKPVAGALVDLWQSSPNGGYDRRGHGSAITSRTGVFRFQGPVPPSYAGRPPHIHIRIAAGGYAELLTRYVVPEGSRSGRITIVLEPGL
jgi:protocatechuate 3,4-dioxygenase beta subunit